MTHNGAWMIALVVVLVLMWRHIRDSFVSKQCGQGGDSNRRPINGYERRLLAHLKLAMHTFVGTLKTKYPNDPRTLNLMKWNGDIGIMDTTKHIAGATFYPNTGCIIVNPYTESKSIGPDDYWRLVTRVLHELAHSTSMPHDKLFYDTQRFFLNVASTDLKWPVKVNCRICCHNEGKCSKQVCPMCNWIEDPHDGCMQGCGTS
jgi:hypothetical protein